MAMTTRLLDLQDEVNFDPKSPSVDRIYYIEGCVYADGLNAVADKVLFDSPPSYEFPVPNSDGFSPSSFTATVYRKSLKPAWVSTTQATCLVKYGLLDALPNQSVSGASRKPENKPSTELCGPEFSFDTSGGTQKILQSKETVWRNLPGGGAPDTAPNLHGVIGYSDGKIEGCDIIAPKIKITYTEKHCPVTPEWLRKIGHATGTTNLDGGEVDGVITPKFMGWEKGELLFTGASGNYRAGEGWVVTFSFEAGFNRTNVTIPERGISSPIVFDLVRAHEYIWLVHEEVTEDSFIFSVPKAGYVERVYDGFLFSQLFTPGG